MAEEKTKNELEAMPTNTAAALTYVLGLISGIIFLAIRRKDEAVHFHAVQSIGLSVIWMAGGLFLTLLPLINLVITPFWHLLMLVLWLVCMVKAYQGEKFKLPVVGEQIQRVGKQIGL